MIIVLLSYRAKLTKIIYTPYFDICIFRNKIKIYDFELIFFCLIPNIKFVHHLYLFTCMDRDGFFCYLSLFFFLNYNLFYIIYKKIFIFNYLI
jgi:hypothetical protein